MESRKLSVRLRPFAWTVAAAFVATACHAVFPPQSGAASTPVQGALYENGPSGRYLLSGVWHRRADRANRGLRRGYQRARSLAGWRSVTVPNAANAGDFSPRSYLGGVWWYRKDFAAPDASPGTTWLLRFESVNYRATVWLNGRRIGSHVGGYLPFELEAKRLRRRGTNRLVVRVDSRRRPLDIPSLGLRRSSMRYVGGWWNYGGILREVYLRRVEGLDLADVNVNPVLPCLGCDATVHVRTTVVNRAGLPSEARLSGQIGGLDVSFAPAVIRPGGRRVLAADVTLHRPRLWSPASPNLYSLDLRLRRDGKLVQSYTQQTGVRSFAVDGTGRLLINGRPVVLRGASMHEDDPARGAALRPKDIRSNVQLLQDLGANMTRAHYPLHPLTLELADRMGIVVWSEIPVYQMREALFRSRRVRRQALGLVRALVLRDRNHASTMVWSLGNENTNRPGPGFTRYLRAGARLARRLDPTRLVGLSFPGYPTVGRQGSYTQLDALGVNDYFGWYPGPKNSIADRGALGSYLDRLHGYYQRQALFVTEFGAEANRSGPAAEKGTFEFQRDFLAYHLNVIAQKPFVNGALVWILKDFHVKPGYDGGNPRPSPPENTKGLVDENGTRKPAFDTVKQLYGAR